MLIWKVAFDIHRVSNKFAIPDLVTADVETLRNPPESQFCM